MASLSEHAAAPSGPQEISALADVWAAMAVQSVLEPDLDEILQMHLKRLYRQLQSVPQDSSVHSGGDPIGDGSGLKAAMGPTPRLYLGGGYFSRFSISKLSKIWPL